MESSWRIIPLRGSEVIPFDVSILDCPWFCFIVKTLSVNQHRFSQSLIVRGTSVTGTWGRLWTWEREVLETADREDVCAEVSLCLYGWSYSGCLVEYFCNTSTQSELAWCYNCLLVLTHIFDTIKFFYRHNEPKKTRNSEGEIREYQRQAEENDLDQRAGCSWALVVWLPDARRLMSETDYWGSVVRRSRGAGSGLQSDKQIL